MVLRFRRADKATFENIRSGVKKVETRAASKKYQRIEIGDEITFVCGGDTFKRRAKKVSYFKDVDDLLRVYSVGEIMPSLDTAEELKESYKSYPGYKEKIKQFGLVAVELTQ